MHRVLILEDNEDDLFFFSRAVKKSGINLSEIDFIYREDGESALTWVKENGHPELVITDNYMVPMDGVRFIESIKRLDDMKAIPVAMWTDYVDDPAIESVKDNLVSLFNKKYTEELPAWISKMIDIYVTSTA